MSNTARLENESRIESLRGDISAERFGYLDELAACLRDARRAIGGLDTKEASKGEITRYNLILEALSLADESLGMALDQIEGNVDDGDRDAERAADDFDMVEYATRVVMGIADGQVGK